MTQTQKLREQIAKQRALLRRTQRWVGVAAGAIKRWWRRHIIDWDTNLWKGGAGHD
jgi:hypothetical protein